MPASAVTEDVFREIAIPPKAIATAIQLEVGVPVVARDIQARPLLGYLIDKLETRRLVSICQGVLEERQRHCPDGPNNTSVIGGVSVQNFWGHAGSFAVYTGVSRFTDSRCLVAVPLVPETLMRAQFVATNGTYSYLPKDGSVSSITGLSEEDDSRPAASVVVCAFDKQLKRLEGDAKLAAGCAFGARADWNGAPALILQIDGGRSLRQALRYKIPLGLETFLSLTDACENIGGHGELAPECVVLNDSGAVTALLSPSVSLASDGSFRTYNFMYNRLKAAGAAADVFAIGAMIYEAVTGEKIGRGVLQQERHGDWGVRFFDAGEVAGRHRSCSSDLEGVISNAVHNSRYTLHDLRTDLGWLKSQ